MSGEILETQNRRQTEDPSRWSVLAKTILRPLLLALIPVAGVAVATWRDDLRDTVSNVSGLVGDLDQVVQWQDNHSAMHYALAVKAAEGKSADGITQYQVTNCQDRLAKMDVSIERLRASILEVKNHAATEF